MGLIKILALSFLLLSLSACGEFSSTSLSGVKQDKASEGVPPVDLPEDEPIDEPTVFQWPAFDWDNQHDDYLAWNKITYDGITELGPSLISRTPADINKFCPNFEALEDDGKKLFWISLISAMSRYESFFDPDVFFQEDFNNGKGEPVISRGLLQLSSESARGYGCPVEIEADLHDPKINLECTVRILNRWVERDGVISDNIDGDWKGGARYWSVLRRETRLTQIRAVTTNFEYCQP